MHWHGLDSQVCLVQMSGPITERIRALYWGCKKSGIPTDLCKYMLALHREALHALLSIRNPFAVYLSHEICCYLEYHPVRHKFYWEAKTPRKLVMVSGDFLYTEDGTQIADLDSIELYRPYALTPELKERVFVYALNFGSWDDRPNAAKIPRK